MPSRDRRPCSRRACRSRRRDKATAQRRQRGRPLLVGRIDLGADLGLDGAEAREVDVEVVRLSGEAGGPGRGAPAASRVRGSFASAPLSSSSSRDSVESLRLSLRRLADLLLLGDDGVLRVRDERGPARGAGGPATSDARRAAREPRPEQATWAPDGGQRGRRPLAADEPIGLGGFVEVWASIESVSAGSGDGPAEAGKADGEFERARDPVAEAPLRRPRPALSRRARSCADDSRRARRGRRRPGWPPR